MAAADQRWETLAQEAGRAFSPTSPIDEKGLFSGRADQLRRVIDAINQKGQHAIIYGERGVGKTSLANVLSSHLFHPQASILAPRINCDSQDEFETVWRKAFDQIAMLTRPTPGFIPAPSRPPSLTEALRGDITPDSVRRALTALSDTSLPIFIVDEFDRLQTRTRRAFADTIKNLSDHGVPATVVMVGVGDSVDELIEEHQSVERALVQIQMPRMSTQEITTILTTGVGRLAMAINEGAKSRIALLAQGLPHYAHLLGLYSARVALDRRSMEVSGADVAEAIRKALDNAQASIRNTYFEAIRSARKDNLFCAVLLACALARTDELGFFAAQDVRPPIRKITGKSYDIPSFAQHLTEFTEHKRGPILMKSGSKRLYRFRFINPLMQPFVIMQGVVNGQIDSESIGA